MTSRLMEFVIKWSWRAVSLLQTERAFQRAQEKGRLVLGRRGIETKLCGLLLLPEGVGRWEHRTKTDDGGPGFGDMSPDVRSRRVREVMWECDLYEGTVLVLLSIYGCRIARIARVGRSSNGERTEGRVLYISCGVEKRGTEAPLNK